MNVFFVILCVFILGCQSTAPYQKQDGVIKTESTQDVRSAIESVAGAVSKMPMRVKYCPVCGKRFSPSVMKCPADGTELKELE
jgi:hypothetical protein